MTRYFNLFIDVFDTHSETLPKLGPKLIDDGFRMWRIGRAWHLESYYIDLIPRNERYNGKLIYNLHGGTYFQNIEHDFSNGFFYRSVGTSPKSNYEHGHCLYYVCDKSEAIELTLKL